VSVSAPTRATEFNGRPETLSPAAEVERSNKKVKVGLCLLVWNEIDGCRQDIPNLNLESFDEVFALDGGSTDGTIEFLESVGLEVVRQNRRGYDWAYIEAFQRTTCDALILYHPKGTVDPETIHNVGAALQQGFDLVIASRNAKGARNEEDSQFLKPRKWFVLALSAVTAAIWWRGRGPVVWDVLHGFRGMRRDAFFVMNPVAHSLSMDLQMVVRSYRMGLTRVEVPIREGSRLSGSTHFKALPTGIKLLKYIWVELRRAKPQDFKRGQTA